MFTLILRLDECVLSWYILVIYQVSETGFRLKDSLMSGCVLAFMSVLVKEMLEEEKRSLVEERKCLNT